jgi:hypothetical protein
MKKSQLQANLFDKIDQYDVQVRARIKRSTRKAQHIIDEDGEILLDNIILDHGDYYAGSEERS